MKLYPFAVAVMAIKESKSLLQTKTNIKLASISVLAFSENDAEGIAWKYIMEECPSNDGWIHHSVSVSSFTQDQIERIRKDE